jgi:hypothetical protein
MSIAPAGENVRRAVKWICAEREDHPEISLTRLIEQAGIQFNLTPLEEDSLGRILTCDTNG